MSFSQNVFGIGLAPSDDAIGGFPEFSTAAAAAAAPVPTEGKAKKPYKTTKTGKARKASISHISKRGSRTDITLSMGQDATTVPTTGFERLADIVQMACFGYAFPSHATRFLMPMAENLIEEHVREVWNLGSKCFVDGKEYERVVHNADLVRVVASNDRLYSYLSQKENVAQIAYAERYRVVNNHLLNLGRKSKGKEYKMVTQYKSPRGLAFFAAGASPAGDLSTVPSLTPSYSISPILDISLKASIVEKCETSVEASSGSDMSDLDTLAMVAAFSTEETSLEV